jgi:AGZA family xanthine/uracil permease-like MFS transporter
MLDKYFKITERGSTLGREIRGGVVTFFTMAYIVALNPLIIGLSKDADGKYLGGGDAPNLALVAAATALIAGVLTILMGVVGNYPLALATGLGLNTFVAVGIASKMSWADAMGLVVLEGIIITVLVLTGFRTACSSSTIEDCNFSWYWIIYCSHWLGRCRLRSSHRFWTSSSNPWR